MLMDFLANVAWYRSAMLLNFHDMVTLDIVVPCRWVSMQMLLLMWASDFHNIMTPRFGCERKEIGISPLPQKRINRRVGGRKQRKTDIN